MSASRPCSATYRAPKGPATLVLRAGSSGEPLSRLRRDLLTVSDTSPGSSADVAATSNRHTSAHREAGFGILMLLSNVAALPSRTPYLK